MTISAGACHHPAEGRAHGDTTARRHVARRVLKMRRPGQSRAFSFVLVVAPYIVGFVMRRVVFRARRGLPVLRVAFLLADFFLVPFFLDAFFAFFLAAMNQPLCSGFE
jgi:hypothetical protein